VNRGGDAPPGADLPRRAVLLAAGAGERLRPETDEKPKALVEVAGKPMLAHALTALTECGIHEAVVVTGYHRQAVCSFLRTWKGAVSIEERFNPRFATANNMVSLACARDCLALGAWIVETDVIAAPSAWLRLSASSEGDARWLAAAFGPSQDGAMLIGDVNGRLRHWSLRRQGDGPVPPQAYKSVGAVAVSVSFGERLSAWLADAVAEGRDAIYYDEVLAEHLAESDVRIVDIGDASWAEVDTLADLESARRLFA